MRQSAGNKTAKILSAARPAHGRGLCGTAFGAIKGPATTTLAWLARIRSSLLLKTASLRAALGVPCPRGSFCEPWLTKPSLYEPWPRLHQQYNGPARR